MDALMEVEVSRIAPWIPPIAGFLISLFTSTAGISGAFLLLPFQMSVLGLRGPSVTLTNHVFNVVATPGGVFRLWKESRLAWPLFLLIAAGSLPGVAVGIVIRIHYLSDVKSFGLFAAIMLAALAVRLAYEPGRNADEDWAREKAPTIRQQSLTFSMIMLRYGETSMTISTFSLIIPALLLGALSGAYGIGGGAFMAPLLLSYFRLPPHIFAGALLFSTCVTSAGAVLAAKLLTPEFSPVWSLGILFGIGGAAGIYTGARIQRRISPRAIRILLLIVVFAAAVRYLYLALS